MKTKEERNKLMNKTHYKNYDVLTFSQLKVLALVAEGLSNDEIAEKLKIQKVSVKTHLRDIANRLYINDGKTGGSHKRVKLALYYIRNYQNIYIVIHNQGIDGSYTVTTFSNYKDAQALCEIYNKTSASGEYDFYYVHKEQINKYDINNFSLKTKDNQTDLYYNRRKFNG